MTKQEYIIRAAALTAAAIEFLAEKHNVDALDILAAYEAGAEAVVDQVTTLIEAGKVELGMAA